MVMSDLLTLVLVLIGVLSLLGVALIGFVVWRYRTSARLTAPLGCPQAARFNRWGAAD